MRKRQLASSSRDSPRCNAEQASLIADQRQGFWPPGGMYAPQRPDACRKASLAADAGRQLQAAAAAVARHRRVRARRSAAVGCGWRPSRWAGRHALHRHCRWPRALASKASGATPFSTQATRAVMASNKAKRPGNTRRWLGGGHGLVFWCAGACCCLCWWMLGCAQSAHAVRTRSPRRSLSCQAVFEASAGQIPIRKPPQPDATQCSA